MICIIRHGETDWNLEGRIQGHKDIKLNNTGIKQAKQIAKELEKYNFDLIFSSPLKRAYHTAKIIANDKNIIIDNRLIERFNGDLEGSKKEECKDFIDFSSETETKFNIEKLTSVRKRIKSFFDEIIKKYPHKNILIITHGGISIYTKCYFEGEPKDGDYNNYMLKNCELLIYDN